MFNASACTETSANYTRPMAKATTTSAGLARLGALLADETRAEILCALMDGRAHTGSELARHIGVAASTMSEHLSRLLDGDIITMEAQGRHRYWRLTDPRIAELLETLGATATAPTDPRAPSDLAHARTCYDHLAGQLAVDIYDQLVADKHLHLNGDRLDLTTSGYALFDSIGADTDAIRHATRTKARACLDWTQRRHHLAGAAGQVLLEALTANGWVKQGQRPRSIRIPGQTSIVSSFGLTGR